MRREKKEKRVTGSVAAKIVAFFILAISFLTAMISTIATVILVDEDVYDFSSERYAREALAYEKMYEYADADLEEFFEEYINNGDTDVLDRMCSGKNCMLEIYEKDAQEVIVSNYNGEETPYVFIRVYSHWEVQAQEASEAVKDGTAQKKTTGLSEPVEAEEAYRTVEKFYECRLYVNADFPYEDEYLSAYLWAESLCAWRYVFPAIAVLSAFIFLISFIFLMCSAGHKNGYPGITPSVLTSIHFDVLTAIFGLAAVCGILFVIEMMSYSDMAVLGACVLGVIEVVWCTIYCMEAAVRLKMGKWWRHTLIYTVFRLIGRAVKFIGKSFVTLLKGLPLVMNTVIVFMALTILEFMGLCIWCRSSELVIVWMLEKIILFLIVLYLALMCKKLQQGSGALAEGNLNYKIDTSKMLLDFKEHGENLNRIGQGISKAVEERMRSEHLKTELITNVSHDLKTPLTSIINYADLIGHEVLVTEGGAPLDPIPYQREKVAEYSEVLLRQSKRLKKLLEDLVEASKATTGSLEVNLQQCEIGVLLSQAVGEYEQRMAEKHLEMIVRQPEEPVHIMADGRHLWRVFDNLLNNICKYAQENTRVYLSVEKRDAGVEIIFRNMSKYVLDISGEELEERFVRGDKSRHMEGNGLGLSIAKSLVELQNGKMGIVIDGDLFKVILYFSSIE